MKRIDLKLSGNDHLAIIAALGVVTDLGLEESDEQAVLNAGLASSASKKLSSGSGSFSPNGARMVLASVSFARLILSGVLDADPEQKRALAPYLFNYNRLYPQLAPLGDMLP